MSPEVVRCRREQAAALAYYQATGAYGGLVWLFDWLAEEIVMGLAEMKRENQVAEIRRAITHLEDAWKLLSNAGCGDHALSVLRVLATVRGRLDTVEFE